MRLSKEEIFYIKKAFNEVFGKGDIYLFGSRAKGYYKNSSDIDIAIEGDFDFRQKRKLKEKVDRVSGLLSVDIVFLSDVSKDFQDKIVKEGKIIYEKK